MHTYRKALLLLKNLLHKSNYEHWENWIARDIKEWDDCKSTLHHKSAFGGMGSINDLSIGEDNKKGIWQNNMFLIIKDISWRFATHGTIEFPVSSASVIEGTICSHCSYSAISELNIEQYISTKYLPSIISTLLPTEDYLELINFTALMNRPEINEQRQKLLSALKENTFNISETNEWPQTCPMCNNGNIYVYRWDAKTLT
jgi:hypothetical protein